MQTVLVVEDAEGLGNLTRRLLERQGYSVLVAHDAEQAERLFEAHPEIDVVLTDVVMPSASGPELIRRLLERRPTLKAVFMSGYTEDVMLQQEVLQPGMAFLAKPFTSRTLVQKIREVLE
jgi:DNA-binding NtrC family response regulator